MSRILILGAGGHAKVVLSTLLAAGAPVVGFADDDPARKGDYLLGIPVLGSLSQLDRGAYSGAVIAIGRNDQREHVASAARLNWTTVVHPDAFVHDSVKLGAGTVVFAGAIIQADAVIGEHVIVNTGATIDHDCHIEDFAHIAPGVHLAGNVAVGHGTLIGIGTAAIPGVRIGRRATVGAGSVIVRNLPDDVVAYGNPARPM